VRYDYASLVVPQREDELAAFDWENFLPSKLTRGKRCFSIVDEGTGIEGKFIARTAFIHGEIQGLVFAEHVTVEKTGIVNGIIFCRTLCIIGHVKADVVCDNVFIRDGGADVRSAEIQDFEDRIRRRHHRQVRAPQRAGRGGTRLGRRNRRRGHLASQAKRKSRPVTRAAFLFLDLTYFLETTARDFSTCSTGEMPSAVEFIEATILPSLPIT